uniref:Homeobox protein abdominal-A n=1 Tax=Glossina pallidipes TaxID=7398 RepID=A0A1A9ZFN3_GLOPL
MSKFVFDSMLPKYPQFQPFISSHLTTTPQNSSSAAVAAALAVAAASSSAPAVTNNPSNNHSTSSGHNLLSTNSGNDHVSVSSSSLLSPSANAGQLNSTSHLSLTGDSSCSPSPSASSSLHRSLNDHSPSSSAVAASAASSVAAAAAAAAAAASSTFAIPTNKMYPYVSNHPTSHGGLSGMPGFSGLEDKSCSRYTDSVMNSYQSMSVPASASASFAQFYQHAAAASAVSAASAGAIGVDSLGNACTQPSSGVVPTGGAGQSIADLPRYPWMTLTDWMGSPFERVVCGDFNGECILT